MGKGHTVWAAMVAVLSTASLPATASTHDYIQDIIVDPNGENCAVNHDFHMHELDHWVCGLLPLTHAKAQIDIYDNGEFDLPIIHQTQSAECGFEKLEAHASVHPWLPETYEYNLRIEVDGSVTTGGDELNPSGSKWLTKGAGTFTDSVKVSAEVYNKFADGRDLYDDGETWISVPNDAAYASLEYDCQSDEWVGTKCAIDGEFEEKDPPDECKGNIVLP